MSWDSTYLHTVLIAVDQFGAAILFNRPDLTISSLCRVVQLADSGDAKFEVTLESLKFAPWQVGFLRRTAVMLEWIQPGHCEAARVADLERSKSTDAILILASAAA